MLPRLTRRSEFLAAARADRSWSTGSLVLQARLHQPVERDSLPPVRVGFTASRKVGGAVVRNRAKRRLREVAEVVLPDLLAPGVDLVLIARAETAEKPWLQLLGDLRWAVKRLGLGIGGEPVASGQTGRRRPPASTGKAERRPPVR